MPPCCPRPEKSCLWLRLAHGVSIIYNQKSLQQDHLMLFQHPPAENRPSQAWPEWRRKRRRWGREEKCPSCRLQQCVEKELPSRYRAASPWCNPGQELCDTSPTTSHVSTCPVPSMCLGCRPSPLELSFPQHGAAQQPLLLTGMPDQLFPWNLGLTEAHIPTHPGAGTMTSKLGATGSHIPYPEGWENSLCRGDWEGGQVGQRGGAPAPCFVAPVP